MKRNLLWMLGLPTLLFSQQNENKYTRLDVYTLESNIKKNLQNIMDSIYTGVASYKIKLYKNYSLKDTLPRNQFSPLQKARILNEVSGYTVNLLNNGNEFSISWLYASKVLSDSMHPVMYDEMCAFDIQELKKYLSQFKVNYLMLLRDVNDLIGIPPLRTIPPVFSDVYLQNTVVFASDIMQQVQSSFSKMFASLMARPDAINSKKMQTETPFLYGSRNDSFYNLQDLKKYLQDSFIISSNSEIISKYQFCRFNQFAVFSEIKIYPNKIGLVRPKIMLAPNLFMPEKELYMPLGLYLKMEQNWVKYILQEYLY